MTRVEFWWVDDEAIAITTGTPTWTISVGISSCVDNDARRWTNCQGIHNFANVVRYEGEFRDGKFNGWGT